MGTLVEIIAPVKELPESYLEKTLERVKEIKEERYEDSSLVYTGINRHKGEAIGV